MRRASVLLLLLTLLLPGCAPQADEVAPALIPDFSITAGELARLTDEMADRQAAERILERPAEFLLLMREILDESPELFLIADKTHSLPDGYEPDDLVSLNSFPLLLGRRDLSLRSLIMPDLLAMDQAARNEGLRLVYSSSYRSYDYQAEVYGRHVAEMGREAADRVSARPGTSQHQLGTVIDFGSISDAFALTPEGRWLADRAPDFGFSLSYPEGYEEETGYVWESWHYRYIGRPAARLTKRYFNGLQHRFLEFLDTWRPWFGERRLP